MATREELHRLVDELPDRETDSARRVLEFLRLSRDPVLQAFEEAPLDDEPETAEEAKKVAEAYDDISSGRTFTSEEIRKDLF